MQAVKATVKVHRAPRKWPYVPAEPVTIQAMQPASKPSGVSVIVTAAGMLGLLLSFVIYSQFGGAGSSPMIFGFLAVSGLSMVASVITFYVQTQSSNQDARALVSRYKAYLDGEEERLVALATEEQTARKRNDLAVPEMVGSVSRHPERAWQRRPQDPDFLAVRVGVGDMPAWVRVELSDPASAFAAPAKDLSSRRLQERARRIVEHYAIAHDVPITLSLREYPAVALVNGSSGTSGASGLARAVVGHLALHHAPQDVQLVVFSSDRQANEWGWVANLPSAGNAWQGLGGRPDTRAKMLSALLAELNRRQQVRAERGQEQSPQPMLPHIVIVVDAFDETRETNPSRVVDPIKSPALALALQHGKAIGASVISVHSALTEAPAEARVAVDVAHKRVIPLGPSPAAELSCRSVDALDGAQGRAVEQTLANHELEEEAALALPSQVALLRLYTPAINRPDFYPIVDVWNEARQKAKESDGKRSFVIPVGRRIGQEVVTLDFVNDGPHGLLIGQTGSGKSELLRSIIGALAISYPPDMVNLVLVDYKGGLAFDAFEHLPHTIAYLTNMAQVSQTMRFLAMLDSELARRQVARANREPTPELFVVIDEFAEMVSRRSGNDTTADAILDNLLSIARLGRELGVHLLFASQRPEGSVIQRLRGYVQFRICLRTNTAEDSREVIGRPDAAQLPVEIPGRGYLLRGDNELQLFQAARVALPFFGSELMHISHGARATNIGRDARTADVIIADRMRQEVGVKPATRWPRPLPMPTLQAPTPLVLLSEPGVRGVVESWNGRKQTPLQPMEVPIGVVDRPTAQLQDWFKADFVGYAGRIMGGPLLVMGDLNSGKTTTLQTLLLALASMQGPRALRWFVLDPTGSLADFAALPHVEDPFEPGVRNFSDGQDDADFRAFSARFERAVQADPSTRPAIILVVDDYDELAAKRTDDLNTKLAQRAMRSRDRKVYLAITGARSGYNGVPPAVINGMATRIALYMNNRDEMRNVVSGRVPVLDAIPGRGVVQTRRSTDEIQIAAPVPGKDDAERLERLTAAIQRCAQQWR